LKAFITAWTVAGVAEKFFADALCDDPRAPLSFVMLEVLPIATVVDDERFVAAASCAPSPIAASAGDSSIATTAAPSGGTRRCNSAPSDAWAENSFRILSINTPGFAVAAICSVGFAFSNELTDLGWGSWEGSLPESSSLGGEG
jgi:hypothetical protein